MIRNTGRAGNFLHIKEVVKQRDPLAIIVYVIVIIPLIREIQDTHKLVMKPYYPNVSGAGGSFRNILSHLE